jgi:phosphoribosylaminoimidazolecarboxamide formyltransferase / IMP cyclohydrolase
LSTSRRKRALISVSDKRGITEAARELAVLGYEILSTGGTAKALKESGIDVTMVSEITGFPEIFNGRVKTLHPKIHGAILVQPDLVEHSNEMAMHGINPIELVIVNLYPFEQIIIRDSFYHDEVLENIDIGGPTMIRAAAKNHRYVTVVVNPERYTEVLEELKTTKTISAEKRLCLAAEAFAHTACYDAMIARYFNQISDTGLELFPRQLSIGLNKIQDLRYGENPQQQAAFYAYQGAKEGLSAAVQLKGKELSFNNLNDLGAAWDLVKEFQKPTVVAVKHANPCGVGSAQNISEAYQLAYEADPVSIFGGVLAINSVVDGTAASEMKKTFLEVIAAPQFTDEALSVLSQKKDLRLLQIPLNLKESKQCDLKVVSGGVLIQTLDYEPVEPEKGKVVSKRKPDEDEWLGLNFAQKVVKHVLSNAIVIARGEQTIGIGAGQMSRIGAARIALAQGKTKAKGAVLGSDAFFPFPDIVEEAAKAGVTAIVQPGGSLKDQESIEICDHYGLAMVFTGKRYFKH